MYCDVYHWTRRCDINKLKRITKFMDDEYISPELAEIIGLLCAEGSYVIGYSSYWLVERGKLRFRVNDKSERIEFCNKDPKLLEHFSKLLLKVFNYQTKSTKHHKVNICKVAIVKKILSLTNIGHSKWYVPGVIMAADKKIIISFIRGYFDGDGSSSKYIRFFSTNEHGLNQVQKLLQIIGFRSYFEKTYLKESRKPLFTLHVENRQRESFLSLIQPVSKIPGNAGVIHKQMFVDP